MKLRRSIRKEIANHEQLQGYRSEHYNRNLTTTSGDFTLEVPNLKGISFETAIIERYPRRESSVEEALIEMYLVVTWRILSRPCGAARCRRPPKHISTLKIGGTALCKENGIRLCGWNYLRRNWGGEFEKLSILVAIAVNEDDYREVLGAAEGMKGRQDQRWVNFFSVAPQQWSRWG